MKVIGAGFGRTGTLSLKLALEKLGFGKCYHMEELLAHPDHIIYWEALYQGKDINWNELFKDFQSTVDFPGYRVYKEIYRQFPQAKVILNTRDPDKWYESAFNTIYKAGPSLPEKILMSFRLPFSPKLRKLIRVFMLAEKSVWKDNFRGKFGDKAFALSIYKQHHEEVKRVVPNDNLLIYDVKQGWKPLCQFLGVPVPDEPFPRVNERNDFKRKNKELIKRNTI